VFAGCLVGDLAQDAAPDGLSVLAFDENVLAVGNLAFEFRREGFGEMGGGGRDPMADTST
jgi:hypothetical protein